MKWPFILRTDHDEVVRLNNVIICSLQQKVADMGIELAQKDKEIEALVNELSFRGNSKEVLDESRKKSVELPLRGRGGWRARATKRTRDSIPTPKDSAQALEDKVKKEGGQV